jgi:hypothetical protein
MTTINAHVYEISNKRSHKSIADTIKNNSKWGLQTHTHTLLPMSIYILKICLENNFFM